MDGELKATPRRLFAVAQLLRGAREGVDIPESVLRSVRRKVTAYYHKLGDKAPWEEPGGTEDDARQDDPAETKASGRQNRRPHAPPWHAVAACQRERLKYYHASSVKMLVSNKNLPII